MSIENNHNLRAQPDRPIDYLRVSITDRCNLRCRYCMPEDLPFIPHEAILRYEEITRLCTILANMGIRTLRVTGGEPLVRKGCVGFLKTLKGIPGIEHVMLTTNGVLLEPYVDELIALKLDGVNISLDSLDPACYTQITGLDAFAQVWSSLLRLIEGGLRVKINCVPIQGLNDHEIADLARLAETLPMDVRFIELMPANTGANDVGVPGGEIIRRLSAIYPDLSPDSRFHGFGPARYFHRDRLKGSIGVIAAISNHFCATCNRLRLTSEGFLKLCLHHSDGLDLRALLRDGADDHEITAAIAQAAARKPKQHAFRSDTEDGGIQMMPRIGG